MRWLINSWWWLIRFGFRLLYNELAFTYDVVSKVVSLGSWRCWQRSALDYLPEPEAGNILELAHGTGNIQIDLKQAGYYTVGYDLSTQMGCIAGGKLRRKGLESLLVQGRAQELPFADTSFPAVVVTFPTPFIFEDDTLHEVHRVLAAGGVLVIVTNGIFVGGGLIARLLEFIYRITGQRADTSDENLSDTSTLPGQIEAVFKRCGFDPRLEQKDGPRSRTQLIVAHKLALPKSA